MPDREATSVSGTIMVALVKHCSGFNKTSFGIFPVPNLLSVKLLVPLLVRAEWTYCMWGCCLGATVGP